MNAALRTQVGLMLKAPWQWRLNQGRLQANAGYAFWGLFMALVVALPPLLLPRPVAWIAVGVLACMMLLVLWALQFSALLQLDHPHAAHFVVGHGRALRTAALGLWLLGVVVACVFLVLTMGLARSDVLSWPLLALAAGAALLTLAMALRWWGLWLVMWVPFPLLDQPAVLAALKPWGVALRELWQTQPVFWALLGLLLMATMLSHLFGRADSAHARAYAGRERLRKVAMASTVGQKTGLAAFGRWGEVLGSPFQRMADAWLAHVTKRARPHLGSVMARADVVLYGGLHWVRHVGAIVVVQAVLLIVLYGLMRTVGADKHDWFRGSYFGLFIGLSSMSAAPLMGLHGSLWGSRREQALLVLLPGMPQGAALNRALARRQLMHYLLAWAAVLPAFIGLAWLGQAPHLWAFVGTALPLAAAQWRDVSRLRAPGPIAALLPFLLMMAVVLPSMLLLSRQPTLLLPWALSMMVIATALLWWRGRRLSQWPQALPAGRLA